MIYYVEDDEGIRNMAVYTLKASGFEAKGFADGGELFAAMTQEPPSLIVLDIMLPGEDGISILKKLRKGKNGSVPVIMASAKGTEYDKVLGLDLGADDYLTKPFSMLEMVSRVKAVLRRSAPAGERRELTLGKIRLTDSEHKVTVDDKRIELTVKEYELLKLMMGRPGIVFTRDEILERIWDTNYLGETRTVDVHIGTLRNKLGEYGAYIKTLRGIGYFMEEVDVSA